MISEWAGNGATGEEGRWREGGGRVEEGREGWREEEKGRGRRQGGEETGRGGRITSSQLMELID